MRYSCPRGKQPNIRRNKDLNNAPFVEFSPTVIPLSWLPDEKPIHRRCLLSVCLELDSVTACGHQIVNEDGRRDMYRFQTGLLSEFIGLSPLHYGRLVVQRQRCSSRNVDGLCSVVRQARFASLKLHRSISTSMCIGVMSFASICNWTLCNQL